MCIRDSVYVALSRVTNIENLYIVTKINDRNKFRFHHGRRQATSTLSLLQEFQRLSLNPLQTKAKMILDFISNKKGVSILTFNCQSLQRHQLDLTDTVTKNTNVLLLTETWMDNNQQLDIPNFNCIAQFKRDGERAAGVAIYHNINDNANIFTPNLNVSISNTTSVCVRSEEIGDVCSAICKLENGVEIVMVVIYISPNKGINDIITFIKTALGEYSEYVARWMGHNRHKLPLILAGDFNVNFKSEESEPLKEALHNSFNLTMKSNPSESTTKYGTTIDAVFSRFLNEIDSQTFVSYFSYHKPIVSIVQCNDSLDNNS